MAKKPKPFPGTFTTSGNVLPAKKRKNWLKARSPLEKHPLLAPYRVVVAIPVAWGEMDAYQHVNNIIYLRYFESVRMAYFEQCGFHAHHQQCGIGPILAETGCKFLKPLTYPDTVLAAARVTALGEDRFRQEYALVSKKENRLCAVGHGVIVSYDYRALKKTKMPASIVEQLSTLEGITTWPALP